MRTALSLTHPEPSSAADGAAWYPDHHAYLADELRKLDALLRLRVASFRRETEDAAGGLQHGLYITHEEIDALLSEAPGEGAAGEADARRALAAMDREIGARAAESLRRGVFLGLPRLVQCFGLTPFEAHALLLCLAPELRRSYDRVYAYLQDDITRKRPSVDLVLDLLARDEAERWRARAFFGPQAPLIHAGLLQPVEDPQSPAGSSGLARFLRLDPRILHFLLGHPALDERLEGIVTMETAERAEDVPAAGAALLAFVERHVRAEGGAARRVVVHLHGPEGVGKRALAAAAASVLGRPLLVLDAARLVARSDAGLLLRLAVRESLLAQAPLYLARADAFLKGPEAADLRASLLLAAEAYGWFLLLGGEEPWPHPEAFERGLFYAVELPVPEAEEREAVWRRALQTRLPDAEEDAAERLADRFRLTPGQIHEAAATLADRRAVHADAGPVRFEALAAVCRAQARHALGALATRIVPRYGWDDLVLPDERRAQLRELCDQVRHQRRVFGAWGFGAKLAHGRGLSVLFTGPPGTGKTMAAEVIARDLHLDLFTVDLAGVVSKYIGETEKNLGRVFDEAARSHAVLFFDEADALFGKRTEVSDAHDRYANIETSYLLQRMEAYDGVVILASNLRENLDPAFLRRIRFVVEFAFPDAARRREIWQAHFPEAAPVSADVDLGLLAERLPVAGGTIKNIVLHAAFLAATDGAPIGMDHLRRGARREFEKIGKLWDEHALTPDR